MDWTDSGVGMSATMSATMTELDWQAAVAVSRVSLPRRGAKGRNTRLFSGSAASSASFADVLRQMEQQMEQRVEAVRAIEQSSRLQDVLRPSGLRSVHPHINRRLIGA